MKVSKGMIVALIGGIIVIAGVFLPWWAMEQETEGIKMTASINGWGTATGKMGEEPTQSEDVPDWPVWGKIAMVMGILGLVLGIIMSFVEQKIIPILVIVFGLLAIIFAGLLLGKIGMTEEIKNGLSNFYDLSYGGFTTIIGGVLILIGGAIGMRETKEVTTS